MVWLIRKSTIIQVAIIFINVEKETDYLLALTIPQKSLKDDLLPEVILTDSEITLINAIYELFPTMNLFFCKWNINKNSKTAAAFIKDCHIKINEYFNYSTLLDLSPWNLKRIYESLKLY